MIGLYNKPYKLSVRMTQYVLGSTILTMLMTKIQKDENIICNICTYIVQCNGSETEA